MLQTLGKITVAAGGTPVNALAQAHVNGTDSGLNADIPDTMAQEAVAITIQAWHANAMRIFFGNRSVMNLTTGAGVLGFVEAAGDSVTITLDRSMTGGRGLLDLRELWLDGTTGEGALVSYLRVGK